MRLGSPGDASSPRGARRLRRSTLGATLVLAGAAAVGALVLPVGATTSPRVSRGPALAGASSHLLLPRPAAERPLPEGSGAGPSRSEPSDAAAAPRAGGERSGSESGALRETRRRWGADREASGEVARPEGQAADAEATPSSGAVGGALSGLVRDAAGRPAAGALVRAARAEEDPGGAREVRADRGGGFLLELPAGRWTVSAVFDGLATAPVEVEVAAGGKVQAALPRLPEPPPAWVVRLLDAQAHPLSLPQALVRLEVGGRARQARPGDDPGAVRFDVPPDDREAGAPEPLLGALTVLPGDPRLRPWSGQVRLDPVGGPVPVVLRGAPVVEVRLRLGPEQASASLQVLASAAGPLLAQRTGLGLVGAVGDAEQLLWGGPGLVSSLPDGAREVRLRLGVDVDLPAVVRFQASPHVARTADDESLPPLPRVVEAPLTAAVAGEVPIVQIDLRGE